MLEVFGRDKSAFFDVPVCHPNADSNAVCGNSNGDWTGNVHSPSFHDQVEWRISVISTTTDLWSSSQIRTEKVGQVEFPG